MPQKKSKKIEKEEKRLTEQRRVFLDDMFNDVYANRKRIYAVNFVRGIFFGFGAFIGGTVIVALVVWILSRFVDYWPLVEKILDTLQR